MSARPVLLTGFPSNELACRVLSQLLASEHATRVVCLVPPAFHEAAEAWLATRSDEERARVQLLEGDVAALDLGLSGPEYRELAQRVDRIHHCAAVTYSGAPMDMAERVNVGGTYEVLELGHAAKRLSRIIHWSTLSATADNAGVMLEKHLAEPRSTRLLHTRFRAERLMLRARHQLPITVLRPALLVGDTAEGSLRRLEGLHLLIAGVLGAPRDLPLPLLGPRDAPVNVVPIDYAVKAGLAIARARDTLGRTFHIVEASPPSLGEVLEELSDLLARPAPRGELPYALTRMMLRLPGLHRLVHAQRAVLEELGRGVRCDDTDARSVLNRAGLSCPPLLTHLPKLVKHVSQRSGAAARFAFSAPGA
jgi:thioester reductase-like protein